MTRFLSEALQAPEPRFRLGLKELEKAHAHPNHDIRLSTVVRQETQQKMAQFGLDPQDTTPQELYHALQHHLLQADRALTKELRLRAATHISAEGKVSDGMMHALIELTDGMRVFALKTTVAKRLLTTHAPKHAVKNLGYRSLASCLKHEHVASVLLAAWLSESNSWRKQYLEQYKKLKSNDFEMRRVTVIAPASKAWQTLSEKVVNASKQHVQSFRELGAIVVLPLPSYAPLGSATASLTIALHECNAIASTSTYLKLSQLRSDFGQHVFQVATTEPHVEAAVLHRAVPWQLIQRYYAHFSDRFKEAMFEPHILVEDLSWRSVEQGLVHIAPEFKAWERTSYLGLLHDSQLVSMNVLDVAVNACNQLPFEKRIYQAFQQSLFHELLLQYLSHEAVEQTVANQLDPKLALETVNA